MTKQLLKDPRGQLLANLKKWANSLDKAKATIEGLTVKIMKACHEYVSYCYITGITATKEEAIEKLSASLRRPRTSITSWTYQGGFLTHHKIPVRAGLSATAVSDAYSAFSSLSKAEQDKVIYSLRNEGTRKGVQAVLRKSSGFRQRQVIRKVRDLEQKGLFNKTRMKMELLAFQTFAKSFFGEDVQVYIYNKAEEELMHVNGK